MTQSIGVGFLGCGPVTQAIHLPTLERFPQFRVRRVMDISEELATTVAERVGSDATVSAEDVVNANDIDVVAVCSPNHLHADQVIAACRAGKKAVLCEKPLAVSEAEAHRIAEVSSETGVPVIVGAMHAFDPGWLTALRNWGPKLTDAHTLRYTITLPPNPRFEDFATDISGRPEPREPGEYNAEAAAGTVAGSIMGLAIHDLPLIRQFCPDGEAVNVLSAHAIQTGGYLINLRMGHRGVRLFGVMTQTLKPEWRLEITGPHASLDVAFPNSYVHAGSAVATLSEGLRSSTVGPFPENGYVGEWRYIAQLLAGEVEPVPISQLVDDVIFALRIADDASRHAAQNWTMRKVAS